MAEVNYADCPSALGSILPKLHRFTYQPHIETPMERGVRRRPDGPPIEYFGGELRMDEAAQRVLEKLRAECTARHQLISIIAPDTSERVAVQFITDPQTRHAPLSVLQSTIAIEGAQQTKHVVLSIALQVIGRIESD